MRKNRQMQMNRVHRCVQRTDLPDGVLSLILKKLNNIEVLYSLIGVKKRLEEIASDPIFTEHLLLIARSFNHSILDRFCTEILPRIHWKIKWLRVDPLMYFCSMNVLLHKKFFVVFLKHSQFFND